MPYLRNGAIGARAVKKKYYLKGGDFFIQQAKRTLVALASARLYLCSMFDFFMVYYFNANSNLEIHTCFVMD